MLIDDTDLYDKVWDKVYNELHFKPGTTYTHSFDSNVPFEIDDDYTVFNVEKMDDDAIEKMDSIIKISSLMLRKRMNEFMHLIGSIVHFYIIQGMKMNKNL